jgi:two-component system cell cycle sensor histidine kinase PleC
MARAHAANACVQSDSIKGLAQSIAKPAYHRCDRRAALRRAVPTLIIAFLITICLGAFVQVIDQTARKRAAIKRDLLALADMLAERLDRLASVRQDRWPISSDCRACCRTSFPSWGIAGRPSRHHHRRRPSRSGWRADPTASARMTACSTSSARRNCWPRPASRASSRT